MSEARVVLQWLAHHLQESMDFYSDCDHFRLLKQCVHLGLRL